MKKRILLVFGLFFTLGAFAQDSLNVSLLYNWHDSTLALNYRDARYSEGWGFTQGGREYAVIGSTYGCHIFDITDPQNIYMADQVPANLQGYDANHRDYHDYNGYLYAVGDQQPATLQIIDLSYLPDSVSLVYDSDSLFSTTHNIFIDTSSALLYALNPSSSLYSMFVYSLSNPISPQLVYSYDATDVVHDAYVRNDTAYLNCGNNDGFRVYDFSIPDSPAFIGSLTSYPHQGYNHSGWLTEDSKHYVFADENYGMDVKIASVEDLGNIGIVSQFTSGATDSSVAHNIIIKGNYAYLSYYNDGLQIFDVSDPNNPVKTGFYDTYPLPQKDDFRGAWGVYPFYSSNKVIITDRNSGLYVFDVTLAINSGLKEHISSHEYIGVFPNPNSGKLYLDLESNSGVEYSITNIEGRQLIQGLITQNKPIDVEKLSPGFYIVLVKDETKTYSAPFVKM